MKKIFLIAVFILISVSFLEAAPLKIGSKVDDISLEVWYKNKPAPVAAALGKKTVAILFVTTTMPDPLMLGRVEKMADDLKKKNVEIFLVNNGLPKKSTDVPAWKNLTLPVAFDLKSKLFDTIGGNFEKIPFWVVIAPDKRIAWRGGVSFLPALIQEMTSGRYTIEEAVRREDFTRNLRNLLRDKKFAEAVKSITAEQKFEPGNLELLSLKCNILLKKLLLKKN